MTPKKRAPSRPQKPQSAKAKKKATPVAKPAAKAAKSAPKAKAKAKAKPAAPAKKPAAAPAKKPAPAPAPAKKAAAAKVAPAKAAAPAKAVAEKPAPAAKAAKKPAKAPSNDPSTRAAVSLVSYLQRLALHTYAQASEAGAFDEEGDPGTQAWSNRAKWLFLTAYYLLDDEVRGEDAVLKVVEECADVFDDAFASAEMDEEAIDDEFLAAGAIFTGTKSVPGPTSFAKAIKKRAVADGLDDGLVDDDEDEDETDDDDE